MRSYPLNSPEAAARIVAVVLISDGHVCRTEVEALQQLHIEHELGMAPGSFSKVVHTLCEDLLMGTHGGGLMMCSVDETILASFLSEVDEPGLQAKVLRLASAAAEADRHLADAEALVMAVAHQHWRGCDVARQARAQA